MSPLMLGVHLLAATSMPLAVGAAYAALSWVSGWLDPKTFEVALVDAALPALLYSTLAMYGLHFFQTLNTYRRGATLNHMPVTPGPPPTPGPPAVPAGPPPELDRVVRGHWEGVGTAVVVFLLFLGVGVLAGGAARRFEVDLPTIYVLMGIGRVTLFIGALMLVFSLVLMTTHALRGVVRSLYWSINHRRPVELRPNLPLEVGLTVVAVFIGLFVMELKA